MKFSKLFELFASYDEDKRLSIQKLRTEEREKKARWLLKLRLEEEKRLEEEEEER